jgi:serine/threonine protein kinase
MPAVASVEQFLETLRRSNLVDDKALNAYLDAQRAAGAFADSASVLAKAMIRDGLLTRFQAGQVLQGKTRGFVLNDKYKLLEHLGTGGMGTVYLCEHTTMLRRVAIKVLPLSRAKDPSYLERFYREARAVARLDHPNIVRAHDIDHDDKVHFLVMEYIDGSSLQEIVGNHGPLDPTRAAHYIAQAALGLQHAHESGLVHRDIKPANLILDRQGTVKLLDLGLARFFHDDDRLSKKYDETVLGTSDYLAPEQTMGSDVDIRADVYSLGATFYFCLTGQTLFGEGTAAQKLIWHTTRQPRPISLLRPEVPEELANLVEKKMLAKDPAERFQEPIEIFEALAPWTATPIPAPPEEEMPKLSRAAGTGPGSGGPISPGAQGPSPSGIRRSWTVSGTGSPRPNRGSGAVRPAAPSPSPHPPAASTDIGNRNGPSTGTPGCGRNSAVRGSGSGVAGPEGGKPSGTRGSSVDITEAPTEVRPAGSRPILPAPAPRRTSLSPWLLALIAVVVLAPLALVGAGALLWLMWWQAPPAPVAEHHPPPQERAAPRPEAPVAARAADVSIRMDRGVRRVQTPKYEAFVEPDGCLTSLRIGGVEFLHAGGSISRGSYFFQNGAALKLPSIEQPGDNVLQAGSAQASIRYEFGPDTLTWNLINHTAEPLVFFLVLDPGVTVVTNDAEDWSKTPVTRDWKTTTWFAGKARLHITGSDALWGPFENRFQVWQTNLAPHASRQVVLEAGDALPAELNQIARVTWEHRVQKPGYEAVVASDGCMTSLRLGGAEMLWVGTRTSRGVYFLDQSGTLKLPDIKEEGPDAVTATSDKASIRYEFGPDTLTWTVSNRTDKPLSFFAVFGPAVTVVSNDKGDWAKTPTKQDWKTTSWYVGTSKLTITGGMGIWGPWGEGPPGQAFQVWDGGLQPKETRQVVLKVDAVTGAEASKIASLTGVRPDVAADLALTAPLEYQVFQRYARTRGQIALRGKVRPACDKVEARVTGKSLDGPLPGNWKNVSFDKKDRSIDTTLPEPAGGWYKLEVRALHDKKVVAETAVDHVGIGEVFVIAGQSNATNCGEEPLRPQSGLVASFSGTNWQPADDPQPGVHDKTGGGSCWPAFGDALVEKYHVPVGIASTGHSGSSVSAWQPGGEYFNWMMARVRQLGTQGFRAVLWHQGESDVGLGGDEYARLLTNVIEASKKEAGWEFPWFVAQVSYHNPEHPAYASTRMGQKQLWDMRVAQEGPDTDKLTGDNRDQGGRGIHFSAKGERAHGKLWAEKVSAYLDKVLAE